MSRRRKVWVAAVLVAASALTAALAWFQPRKLWVDTRVDEALPAVALQDDTATPTSAGQPTPVLPGPSTSSPVLPAKLLARGSLISHEHATRGQVSVVRQPDGSRVLAIAKLDTSDGPDLHVWLTDAPVRRGTSGWYVFADGRHVDLGTLKGNLGNQLYRIPRNADLSQLTSVSLWCARFDVSFGAAALRPVA